MWIIYLPSRSHLFICGLFCPHSREQAAFPDTAEPVTRKPSNLLSPAISLSFQSALATGVSSILNYHTCHLGPVRMNGMSQIKLWNQSLCKRSSRTSEIQRTRQKAEIWRRRMTIFRPVKHALPAFSLAHESPWGSQIPSHFDSVQASVPSLVSWEHEGLAPDSQENPAFYPCAVLLQHLPFVSCHPQRTEDKDKMQGLSCLCLQIPLSLLLEGGGDGAFISLLNTHFFLHFLLLSNYYPCTNVIKEQMHKSSK